LRLNDLVLALMTYGLEHPDREHVSMRTIASINRKALLRAKGGLKQGPTLKSVKAPAMPKGQRRGK
jgi:hypothetical protein